MHTKGKTVTLRAIEESDLETLHRWGNDYWGDSRPR